MSQFIATSEGVNACMYCGQPFEAHRVVSACPPTFKSVTWAATEDQDARAFAVYSVWAQAQARAGVTVAPWPNVLQDDKQAWLAVADSLAALTKPAP